MAKKEIVKIGLVGHGPRGEGILKTFLNIEGVKVVAVCDIKEECLKTAESTMLETAGYKPLLFTDYDEMLKVEEIDAIINTAAWSVHIEMACKAMKAGKDVAIEAGGAYSVRECWKLVETQQETKRRCMMLENCCYGRTELALLKMKREGKFGEIVHASGGYIHDLRYFLSVLQGVGLERLENHQKRNCDNYPTHALGPIAKILDINRGNRMVSLVSMASKGPSLEDYFANNDKEITKNFNGSKFAQGDHVTTIIKCANGETITMEMSQTLPRPYTRNLGLFGTKGGYLGTGNQFYFDDMIEYKEDGFPVGHNVTDFLGNADSFIEQNDHPIWEEKVKNGDLSKGGHGGMDRLVCKAFIESIRDDVETPIDVFDCASWMVISTLSEDSIALGGAPVAIPDFTNGKWVSRKFVKTNKWSI